MVVMVVMRLFEVSWKLFDYMQTRPCRRRRPSWIQAGRLQTPISTAHRACPL
jgi:hypothetical protein